MIYIDDFKFKVKNEKMTLVEYVGDDKKVIIPCKVDGLPVTVIGKEAFVVRCEREKIKEIVLPDTIEIIEVSAFWGCTSLKKIKLPETLVELRQSVFGMCQALEEITFPKSVQKVGSNLFEYCISLKKVIAKNEKTKFPPTAFDTSNPLEEVSFSILKSLSADMQANLFIDILENFDDLGIEKKQEIKRYLMKKITVSHKILLMSNVKITRFLLDLKLKITLEILDDVLKSSIQREETEVTAILLDYKNKNFSQDSVDDYENNKEMVEIGLERPTLKQLKEKWVVKTMKDCILITGYKGENAVENIPDCISTGKPILNPEIHFFIFRKFYGDAPLETVIFTSGEILHLKDKFRQSTLKEFRLKEGNTIVDPYLCSNACFLEKVVLPSTITEICKGAFNGCTNLKEINFPKDLQVIEENAFCGCENLKEVSVSKDTKIDDNAFEGCTKVQIIIK